MKTVNTICKEVVMKKQYVIIGSSVLCMLCINGIVHGQQNDTWLVLNEDRQYLSGVYTPLHFRADGEIRQGAYDYGSYGFQTSSAIYADDFIAAMGGVHIGAESDPGTDNLIVDGKVAIGKTMAWHTLDVDGDVACDQLSVGSSNPGSFELYVQGQAYVSDELEVDDDVIVDGRIGINTSYPNEALHVNGQVYIGSMYSTSSGYQVRYYNNRLYYETSSARHKEHIRILDVDFNRILCATPCLYVDKTSAEEEIGFIAEALDSLGLTQLVIYGPHGPESVKYDRVSLYLLEILKEQRSCIEHLSSQNEELLHRIELLERAVSEPR
jgi:hypothetical protein